MKKKNKRLVLAAACTIGIGSMYFGFQPARVEAAIAGWEQYGQTWVYKEEDGSYSKNKFKEIQGQTYYFDTIGNMVTGWKSLEDKWYYFSGSGAMVKGWIQLEDTWYYLKDNGVMESNSFVSDTYFVKNNGSMATKEWVKVKGDYYYILENGMRLTNSWVETGGLWYYLLGDGIMATNQWVENQYYVQNSGVMVTGWYDVNGKTYYFRPNGASVTGMTQVGGVSYYITPEGGLQEGWIHLEGRWYYADPGSGAFAKGWRIVDGTWYYLSPSSMELATGWVLDAGQWYFLQGNGAMATGWQLVKGSWYYLNPSNGVMLQDWLNLGGTWYYLTSGSGTMVTGWHQVRNKWYYFEHNGSMRSSAWVGEQYYVGSDGAMYASKNIGIGGVPYRFGADGRNIPFTKYVDPINNRTYYLEPNYFTDPQIGVGADQVSLEDFFTAAVYTEAGDQGDIGMQAVALVMLNRLEDKREFPNDLRVLIYQANQYAIARDGFDGKMAPLTRVLRDPKLKAQSFVYYENARRAVRKAQAIIDNYKANGTKRIIEGFPLPAGYDDFNYLFFMTPEAFNRLEASGSLSKEAVGGFTSYTPNADKTSGHVFFRYWRK